MRISESKVRRIIRAELRRLSEVSEPPLKSKIELKDLNGRMVVELLRIGGQSDVASVIMNPDRPGTAEWIWKNVLREGNRASNTWHVPFPVKDVGYEGMSLHDFGYRNGQMQVSIAKISGEGPINDFDPRLAEKVQAHVRVSAEEARGGSKVEIGKFRSPVMMRRVSLLDALDMRFSLTEISEEYLDRVAHTRGAYFSV